MQREAKEAMESRGKYAGVANSLLCIAYRLLQTPIAGARGVKGGPEGASSAAFAGDSSYSTMDKVDYNAAITIGTYEQGMAAL